MLLNSVSLVFDTSGRMKVDGVDPSLILHMRVDSDYALHPGPHLATAYLTGNPTIVLFLSNL